MRKWSHGHVAMAWICVAAAGLLGAACGGDDGAAVGDPSASAPVTSASTDTAANDEAISVEAAAEQYLALVASPNCALDKLNAAIDDVGTTPSGAVSEDQWPAIQATVVPALVEVEATGRDWATALLRAEWPPLVASHVQALALAVTESASLYGEIARRGGLRHVLRALQLRGHHRRFRSEHSGGGDGAGGPRAGLGDRPAGLVRARRAVVAERSGRRPAPPREPQCRRDRTPAGRGVRRAAVGPAGHTRPTRTRLYRISPSSSVKLAVVQRTNARGRSSAAPVRCTGSMKVAAG